MEYAMQTPDGSWRTCVFVITISFRSGQTRPKGR